MIRNLLTLMLLFIFIASQAQLNEYFDDIKKTYEADEQKTLISISQKIKDAAFKDADIQQKYTKGNVEGALNSSQKISVIYQDSYRSLFLIYEEKLEALSKQTEGDIATYVSHLICKAKNSFRISILDRHLSSKEESKEAAFKLLNLAHENEVEAINFQTRIFGVINGWIKEDFTVIEEDYSLVNNYKNLITEDFIVRDFSEAAWQVGTYQHTGFSVQNSNNNSSSIDIRYRIQIGTSILPASISQIKRLNSTDLPVQTYKSVLYYKYTIGQFTSYQEAKSYKNAYGLAKTYITGYKNGKEVKLVKGI